MAAITVTSLVGDDTKANPSHTPHRGIRGAAGGSYVGPVISRAATEGPATPTHAVNGGGGVEDSTGHRESDTYDASGATGAVTGSGEATVRTVTRPTGRVMVYADGVQGGSTPGRPVASGTDHLNTGDFDGGRATLAGSGGRSIGVLGKTKVDGETVTLELPRPALGTTANPSAGTVAIVVGNALLRVDVHADDITGGASGYKGVEVAVFETREDADLDGDLVGVWSADGDTDIADLVTGLTNDAPYAVYARFRKADGNGKVQVGPWSARSTRTPTSG